jgi:hypothetical protein
VRLTAAHRQHHQSADDRRSETREQNRARRRVLGELDLVVDVRVEPIHQIFERGVDHLEQQHERDRQRHDRCPHPPRTQCCRDRRGQEGERTLGAEAAFSRPHDPEARKGEAETLSEGPVLHCRPA